MVDNTKMSDKWIRFEEGDRENRNITSVSPSGSQWVVLWDDDEKLYFAGYPRSWGGSGWYADPQDVISKPEQDK